MGDGAGQARGGERALARTGRRQVARGGAVDVDRLGGVAVAAFDAPEALDETRGGQVQRDAARAGPLARGLRLDGLGNGERLGARGQVRRGLERARSSDRTLVGGARTGVGGCPLARLPVQTTLAAAASATIDAETIGALFFRFWRRANVSEPPVTTKPIYADRASGQTFPDARAMIDAYLTRFGERAGAKLDALDGAGYTLVRKGSASVGINVLEDHGVLLFVAPVMQVPMTGRETFYRRLLELSFLTTSDAAFAVDAHRDEVVVRALRRLSGLDYEEFEDLLDTVGKVADDWDDVLRGEFGQ